MRRFYVCDEAHERGGTSLCCLLTGEEVDALVAKSVEGATRCERHDALIGNDRGILAHSVEDARRRLLDE
jgi:hypothetical protein